MVLAGSSHPPTWNTRRQIKVQRPACILPVQQSLRVSLAGTSRTAQRASPLNSAMTGTLPSKCGMSLVDWLELMPIPFSNQKMFTSEEDSKTHYPPLAMII